jgi:hypothetical protein
VTEHEACRALARLVVISSNRSAELTTGAGEASIARADSLADEPDRLLVALAILHRRALATAADSATLLRRANRLATRRAAAARRIARAVVESAP